MNQPTKTLNYPQIIINSLIQRYNLTSCTNEDTIWHAKKNDTPVFIKLQKCNLPDLDIELFDYFFASSISYDFYILIYFFDKAVNVEKETVLLKINKEAWQTYFNTDLNEKMRSFLEKIKTKPTYDKEWHEGINYFKKCWKDSTPYIIKLHFKRGQKTKKCYMLNNYKKNQIVAAVTMKDFEEWQKNMNK